ncbi:GGDEF domain-containing protein [Melaminivora alkalimesophila]|uniref:Diguanylate cyclase n=1 Tax=Melaminivora alkalimesophila TaxID=1165852 RepID=A0A317RFP3_9BURK|nr:sensor domain-containing diguanylate cyclase [Melaminivora alkalimesophila]PWW47648.1 diguanylate cyclase [Melaminivora alkalimesophila]
MAQPSPSSLADFEHMFDLAPVSLWLEDYSAVRALFARWRAAGVQDVEAHLRAHPRCVQEYGESIRVLKVNRRTLELFAAPDQAALEAALPQVFKGDMHQHAIAEIAQLWSGASEFTNQTVNYALDGCRLDVFIRGRILPGHEQDWDRVLVSLEDNTEALRAQRRLERSERYARGLFEHSPVSLWVEDFSQVKRLLDEVRAQGIVDFKTFLKVHPEFVARCIREIRVVDVNQLTLQLFGAASKDELLAGTERMFRGEMQDSFAEQLIDLWEGRLFQQREVVNYTLAGELLHIHMQFAVLQECWHDWSMVLLSLVDITARKKAEAYLEYLGKHDVLTGLRNRAYYVEELNRLTRKGPWPVGVLAIDLNGLKALNDEEGHAAGDAMLRRAGEVLAKAVDNPACAARIGGDEFCILLPGGDERAVQAMVERLASLQELNNQFYPGQPLSLSIGTAVARSGESLEVSLQQADQAMYEQKKRYYAALGRNRRH